MRRCDYAWTDSDIVGVDKKAKKGVVAMHHFTSNHEGFEVDIVIRDKGNAQFLYEMKFIENKKSSKQSMTEKSASTAPKGDVWNNETVAQPDNKVKQEFSVEDDAAELDRQHQQTMAGMTMLPWSRMRIPGLRNTSKKMNVRPTSSEERRKTEKRRVKRPRHRRRNFPQMGMQRRKNMVR